MVKILQALWRFFVPFFFVFSIVSCFTTSDWQYVKTGEVISPVKEKFYISTTGYQCVSYTYEHRDYEFNQCWETTTRYTFDEYDRYEKKKIDFVKHGYVVYRNNILIVILLVISFILFLIFWCDYNYPWSWTYRFHSKDESFNELFARIELKLLSFSGHKVPIAVKNKFGKVFYTIPSNDNEFMGYTASEALKNYKEEYCI